MIHLLLPDAWRIELFRRPTARDEWLAAVEARPGLQLLDWTSRKPAAGDVLVVLGLDLAAAEFVLKVPSEVRVVAIETAYRATPGGRLTFLERARARVSRTLRLDRVDRKLPSDAGRLLDLVQTQLGAPT